MPKYWTTLILIGIIILAFWLGQFAKDNEFIKQTVAGYGYAGIFIIAIISGFNLAIPIPAISFLPLFLESGLNIWLIIIIISIGTTLADMIAFSLGRAGRHFTSGHRIIRRFELLRRKSRKLPLFVFFIFAATIPLPNEVLVLPLGFLGYSPLVILTFTFFGNLIFNAVYGLGLINLFNFII